MKFSISAILMLSAVFVVAEDQYPRPRRPESMDAGEQKHYLKELQNYYTIHGRGRYGKRQMHIADASVVFKEIPLFEYNEAQEDPFWKKIGYK